MHGAKAYGVLANVFINREAQIYSENANKNGGWEGTRPFRIVAKTPRSALITSFEFEPVDGGAVAEYHPGQYTGVWLKPEGFPHQEIRQYSLTRKPDGKGYRIAVKREDGGQVSTAAQPCECGRRRSLSCTCGRFLYGRCDRYPSVSDFSRRGSNPDAGDAGYAGKSESYGAG